MAHMFANAAVAGQKWLFHGSKKRRPTKKISNLFVSSAVYGQAKIRISNSGNWLG